MGQRNMMFSGYMIDTEMNQQGQGNFNSEPCVLVGNITNCPQPGVRTVLPAPGYTTSFNVHHIPEHHESAFSYGMTQYNSVQHQHLLTNLDFGVTTAPNFCNPYMIPSVSNDFGGNNHFMEGFRGPFKRKNAESVPGNLQYYNGSAGSSSSVPRPLDSGVTSMDASSFSLPEYRGNEIPAMEVGHHRSGRNRSGAIGLDSHTHNHMIQGNYLGQPFQMATTPCLDQQFGSNVGNGSSLAWNQAPPLTYVHGSNVNGYHEMAGSQTSANFLPLLPLHQGNNGLFPAPPPMQGPRSHNINFQSQVAVSSHRLPFQNGIETGPRYVGPVPPTGFRMHRPERRTAMLDMTPRHRSFPQLRVLPADEVAILDVSSYYEVGRSPDQHRDMRLDVDHMSYEELLALGEQIGNVGTGLSEKTIVGHLKTRTYVPSNACTNLEGPACLDHETDSCVICQTDYKNQEKIGTLGCGHEYHIDCIKKWLIVKNACPICKSSALSTERKDL